MFDMLLHTGTEHPTLTTIVLASLVSFAAGLGIGTYSRRIREVARTLAVERSE